MMRAGAAAAIVWAKLIWGVVLIAFRIEYYPRLQGVSDLCAEHTWPVAEGVDKFRGLWKQ